MWEQNIYDSYVAPSAVFAPASGRFALSRLTTRGSIGDMDLPLPEFFGPQSVVVYQIDSGKQLLRVESLPVQRAGQNFSLSPDGMSLAVLHFDEIDIYSLPPLTPKDQTAVKEAQAMAPPESDTPVSLSRSVAVSPSSSAISVPPPPPPSGSQPPDATSNQTNTGDASATPPPDRSNQGQAAPQADHPPVADNSAAQPDQQNRRPPSLYSPEAPHPDAPPAESPK
jgi:hypothetical protein